MARLARRVIIAGSGRLLYQTRRETPEGEAYVPRWPSWPRVTTALNQFLFERGLTPPWVLPARDCEDFWATRSNQDDHNGPARYASKSLEMVRFLNDFWAPEVTDADSLLELGCNCGPNLAGLQDLGFRALAGVEINPAAVQEMRRSFPALADSAEVMVGSFEEVLPNVPSASYDVILTVASLQHVHPSGHRIMADIVRIARRHICIVETEWITHSGMYARNYKRVFERLGAEQVRSEVISASSLPERAGAGSVGYVARLFRVPTQPVASEASENQLSRRERSAGSSRSRGLHLD